MTLLGLSRRLLVGAVYLFATPALNTAYADTITILSSSSMGAICSTKCGAMSADEVDGFLFNVDLVTAPLVTAPLVTAPTYQTPSATIAKNGMVPDERFVLRDLVLILLSPVSSASKTTGSR